MIWTRRRRLVLGTGVIAAVIVSTWAMWPLPDHAMPSMFPLHPGNADTQTDTDRAEPLDIDAFAAAIWNPVPPPEVPVLAEQPQPRPVPPPKLQLLGITHDTDTNNAPILRAALYDPDTDRLYLVASGEQIGTVTVAEVDEEGVLLQTGNHTSRLALRDEPEGRR